MADSDPSDEMLMTRYRGGDAGAFEALYRRHKGPLYRYLLRQCGDRPTADELFQDVWMGLIRARERYRVKARFQTYLYHLAHNRLVDHYRRTARGAPPGDPPDPDEVPAAANTQPENRAHAAQQIERLLKLLRELPDAQREAFLLREEGGLGLDEIAQVTGVGREAAKSRLRYAVGRLRQALGDTS